ncbi:uncharacterized protein LOC142656549 [Rhinoderma darwinii]|uniref:uncharacterized protein LOC142656549 n=1 Tax=Rhinoderma darwinii TaxID=43563 RepID=UPI003F667854
MEPSPTGFDGSSRRNPLERCPSPLYSQDCPEENHNVPESHQGVNLIDIKVEVKDEAEEEETDLMADQQYGSSRRNPPERSPSPLYSQDCPEENHNVPENHQGKYLIDIKVEVKEEAEEETNLMADQQYGSSRRNPPERCPSPLYSQDCPEESHNVPENHQGEDLTNNKAEDEAEEERVRGDQPCKSEVEEEMPGGVTTEIPRKNSEANLILLLNYKVEDEDIMQHCSGENLITLNVHPGLLNTDLSYKSPNHEEPSPDQSQIFTTSTDGSSRRNPPERRLSPLYSQNCPEENHNVPENHQGENLIDIKVEVKEEAEGEMDLKADQQYASSRRNPPERCPNPLFSQDCPEQNPNVPENHQGEDLTYIKAEGEEERVRADQPCKSEVEEEIRGGVTTEKPRMNSEGNFVLSLDYKVKDEDIMQHSSGENLFTLNVHPGIHSTDPSYCPKHEEPSPDQSQIVTTNKAKKEDESFQCGKAITKSSGHFTHQLTHTGLKPYSCLECGKCFTDESSLVKHQRIHIEEKTFACLLCGECFMKKSDLVKHEISHTDNKPYSCSDCGKCFTQKRSLFMHQRIHTGENPFSCLECGKCFKYKSSLVKHKRIHTGQKPYSCAECGKRFNDKSSLGRHKKSHTGEKPYSCSECGKCFKDKSGVVIHDRTHTGEKPYACSKCGKCFKDKSSLVRHERIHTGEKPYSCSECVKCFKDKSGLLKHQKIHTGENPYSCSECGKCFKDKSSLVTHERSHTGEKPYSCSLCGKCFTNKSILVRHERGHTGAKPYSCSECGKCFTDKSKLFRHEKSHTGEKPYSCLECGKCFKDKSTLVRHERIHTVDMSFSCSECGKCFKDPLGLIKHQEIHTGNSSFTCSECGKCFPNKSIFAIHQRSHTGEKPYSCSECGKCFTQKSSLVKHEISHTGEKPFSCLECGK